MEAIFTCSICGERSHDICEYCTKDTCANHLCLRCRRCSDCCECESRTHEEHEDHAVKVGRLPTNGTVDTGFFPV